MTMLDTPQIVREPKVCFEKIKKPKNLKSILQGVVLILSPWNYPLNTLLTPLVAVLAAGNTAILKPSEISANTAQAIDEVLSKAFDKVFIADFNEK